MTITAYLLALGATTRLTRFLNSDVLAEPIRDAVYRRFGDDSRLSYLISCPWCASIWIASVVMVTAWLAHGAAWWYLSAGALTASYLCGLAATRLDPAGTDPDLPSAPYAGGLAAGGAGTGAR